ncbi:MAG: hypothetical protein MRQ13_04565 [Candidatus Midichloria sp.]|nr:hypothetical protein [Candidatus Midichloria sp.]
MAAKGAKTSKNNIANRGTSAILKKVDGKEVKPVMYKGRKIGHGNYVAAKFDNGDLVRDAAGRPVPYQVL